MKIAMQKIVSLLLLSACISAGLSACAPAIVGGAVVGTFMATDRRTSGTQIEDEGIELRGSSRVRENLGERGHVNVTSYNRQVLLTGEVPTEQDKQLVEQILSRVENVRAVVNELEVLGESTLTQRSSSSLCSSSKRVIASGSRSTLMATMKSTPCLPRLASALASSHSNS